MARCYIKGDNMYDKIGLSPGIPEPLCGWQFYEQHKHDIVPCEFEVIGDVRYHISVRDNTQINRIVNSVYK